MGTTTTHCEKLKNVRLRNTSKHRVRLSDDAVRVLLAKNILVGIDLEGTSVGNASVTNLPICDKLSAIRLTNTQINDDGIEAVANVFPD